MLRISFMQLLMILFMQVASAQEGYVEFTNESVDIRKANFQIQTYPGSLTFAFGAVEFGPFELTCYLNDPHQAGSSLRLRTPTPDRLSVQTAVMRFEDHECCLKSLGELFERAKTSPTRLRFVELSQKRFTDLQEWRAGNLEPVIDCNPAVM